MNPPGWAALALIMLAALAPVSCAGEQPRGTGVVVVNGYSTSRHRGGFLATNRGEDAATVTITTEVPRSVFGLEDLPPDPSSTTAVFTVEIRLAPGETRWVDFRDLKGPGGKPLPTKSVITLCFENRKHGGWPFEVIAATRQAVDRFTVRIKKVYSERMLP